jgi:valyl-tRNA synthetase
MAFENKYDSKEREAEILKFWEENKIFKFDEKSQKVVFSIDTPPPTISGRMHIGHSFSYTQTDFIARYKRMKGFEVYYPFGTDDNGLATEKLVQKEKKVNLRKVSREEAIKICMDFLEEERPRFIEDFQKVGLSCDFSLRYSTIDDNSRKFSQKTFLELAEKGLIEQREGPVPWDRVFQTPIAQAELEDKEMESFLNYIKAKVKGTENTYLIYATTRPELLHGCVGINVEDIGEYVKLRVADEYWIAGKQRYSEVFKRFDYEVVEEIKGQDVIGERVIIPISDIEVEITHDVSVKADYGTGVVYYCTYGGMDCIEWMARRPHIKPIRIIDEAGRLSEICGKYKGMIASEEARKAIIDDLRGAGHLIKQDKIKHIVNVGERSGAEVEYIVAKQWYVKYLDKKDYFFEMAQKFNWHPEYMKHRLENWIRGLNWDWGFSRQRHFGIPIPVWYCNKCGEIKYAQESQLPVDPTTAKPNGKCRCGSDDFVGETDIMDTWFTSASSPFLALRHVKNEKMRKKLFPMDLRPQAHDIINFWLFYTMAKTNLLYGENPFEHVAVSGFVLDPQGKKMSKSKGNTISPQEVVAKYSNDSLRYAASSTKLGNDMPFQEKEVQSGVKLANKLYNANKFASMLLDDFTKDDIEIKYDELRTIDKWIIARCQEASLKSNKAFENYDYQQAKQAWYDFFMSDVADNYIEIVKERLWKKKANYKAAQSTLYNVLYASLRGLAPIMPYVAEEIYQNLYRQFENAESIHKTQYPEVSKKYESEDIINSGNKFVEIISIVRKFKAENRLSMKEELSKLTIDDSDRGFHRGFNRGFEICNRGKGN